MPLDFTGLAAALDESRVPCPGEYHHNTFEGPPCCLAWYTRAPILMCDDKYTIPNPALEPLRGIVREKCPRHPAVPSEKYPCRTCGGSGKRLATAFWEAAGEGALAGRLVKPYISIQVQLHPGFAAIAFDLEIQRWFDQDNPDQAAVDALEKAVRSMEIQNIKGE